MTKIVPSDNDIKKNIFEKIKDVVQSNLLYRLVGEALSALFFILVINSVIALGEDRVPVLNFFYDFTFGTGIWIATMTIIAFVWSTSTTLSANVLNLVLAYRRKDVNKVEFWTSIVFQFLGGIIGALIVYFIAGAVVDLDAPGEPLHSMGGALPKLKGLTLTNVENTSIFNPWQDVNFITKYGPSSGDAHYAFIYLYASLQGVINASWIIIAFYLNSIVSNKNSNNRVKELLWRYIILLIGISITTIFYANTTNWVRLLTPNIVNVLAMRNNSLLILSTTLIFIAFQCIGLWYVYSRFVEQGEEK